jgi:purine nucleoside phosphorylase
MTKTVLGIIGGSGVYQIDGLENATWQTVKSPWGEPSDQLLTGTYAGVDWCSCRAMAAAMSRRPARSTIAPISTP